MWKTKKIMATLLALAMVAGLWVALPAAEASSIVSIHDGVDNATKLSNALADTTDSVVVNITGDIIYTAEHTNVIDIR